MWASGKTPPAPPPLPCVSVVPTVDFFLFPVDHHYPGPQVEAGKWIICSAKKGILTVARTPPGPRDTKSFSPSPQAGGCCPSIFTGWGRGQSLTAGTFSSVDQMKTYLMFVRSPGAAVPHSDVDRLVITVAWTQLSDLVHS